MELYFENCSVIPAAINTVIMAAISLLLAVPFGIGSAIYLVEYAKKGNKLVKVIRVTAETLTGIPSIVYGLFGMLFFVTALKWKFSILAGAFTLAIMILPVILRTTEEALLSVPDSYREGSFGLGAGKLRTIFANCSSGSSTGNPFRCYPCNRTNRRRNSRIDLYCRKRSENSKQCIFFWKNVSSAYVFTCK